jgi:GNAT superfamily N-acetyltransferase
MSYLTEPLDAKHKRDAFLCGKDLLDNYFRTQVKQEGISGYYTLSSNSISNDFIPESFKKNLPKTYLFIPAILLGRLAVDKSFQGKGFGKLLLIDSLKRCWNLSKSIGAFAVIVDPLDDEAEKFYAKYGFIKLPDSGKMFLPMKTIKMLFDY